jgi:phosphotransferase family enzyme
MTDDRNFVGIWQCIMPARERDSQLIFPMSNTSPLPWHDPDWQKQAREWIRAETEHHSIHITGEIEQPHALAWSTVMRIPSDHGTVFFKATSGETIYGAALTQKLATWYPDCMPELIALDIARGWMLMRDGGDQLRASIRPTKDIQPWKPVITRYAELQIGLADHIPEILSLGIPDYRLAKLPALYAKLLEDEASLMIDQEKGLTSAEFQQNQSLIPRLKKICADLAAFGIPESINHGDFHDGNILLRDGRITFFDWGDASVTHPFVSLRTFFVSMEISLEMKDDYPPATPEMMALLDQYLEKWEKFAPKEELLKAYVLSRPVASVVSALQWHLGITHMQGSVRKEYAWIVPELLREIVVYEKMLGG